MLSTQKKRIIFCGNWTYWYPNWNYLDDDNSKMSYDEFIGKDYMKKNITNKNSDDMERVAEQRNKLNRVIDSSEYVIRCSHGKTSNPTSSFTFHGSPSPSYGSKTDVVGFFLDFIQRKKYKVIKNHFNDLEVRFGINEDGKNNTERWILKSYGSRMVASQMDEINKKESWMPVANFYKIILNETLSGNDLRRRISRSLNSISDAECILGQSLKTLSIDSYIELCNQVKNDSISYDELKNMIRHKKWSEPFFKFHNDSHRWMKTEEERCQWMDLVKSNWHVNRGLELIWMMMEDKRFEDYDKYIIGVMGINECFKFGLDCQVNQWGEYIWMSNKIKNKELLFLPEHVDDLYDNFLNCISETGFNLDNI